jgi:hypothetical protein
MRSGRYMLTFAILTNMTISNVKQEYDSISEMNIIFVRVLLYLSIVWDWKFTFLKIYRVSNIVSIFQFFVIHHICSWVHQGSKPDISLRSICRKIFLLWYSFMIHKGYFSLPSLAKRTCSAGTPKYCPSVWPWEKKRYWIYICLLHIKDSVVTITKFAAS